MSLGSYSLYLFSIGSSIFKVGHRANFMRASTLGFFQSEYEPFKLAQNSHHNQMKALNLKGLRDGQANFY